MGAIDLHSQRCIIAAALSNIIIVFAWNTQNNFCDWLTLYTDTVLNEIFFETNLTVVSPCLESIETG